ncbi:hypothetical protein [Nocardia cyriacigeorgica]|uniref:hypothetical protein n=1 Tax=Nocardia cyriacigeorgica TaxID=135487 RepID=UPI002454BDF1|nr:hypothetical protein [Nocardia cyriacigeorgica]
MTVANLYGQFHVSLLSGEINVIAHELRAVLLTSAYAPDLDTHRYQSSLTNELPTGNGYTAGGQVLTGKSLAYDAATNTAWLDLDNPIWTPSTITARYCAIVDTQSGVAATNPLIALVDFEADKSSDNAPFEINVNVAGILRLTAN